MHHVRKPIGSNIVCTSWIFARIFYDKELFRDTKFYINAIEKSQLWSLPGKPQKYTQYFQMKDLKEGGWEGGGRTSLEYCFLNKFEAS